MNNGTPHTKSRTKLDKGMNAAVPLPELPLPLGIRQATFSIPQAALNLSLSQKKCTW